MCGERASECAALSEMCALRKMYVSQIHVVDVERALLPPYDRVEQ